MKFLIFFFAAFTAFSTQARTKLEIVGTGDGIDLLRSLANAYSSDEKLSEIIIPPSIGSGGGINAVGQNQKRLGRVARKLKPEEVAEGINYVPIARIPTAFFVNKNLKIRELTEQQLVDIYTGKLRNWRDLGGPDLRIRVVRREDGDSSLQALRATLPLWRQLVFTERTKMATSTQEAIETVHEVAGAIGFGPFSSTLQPSVTVLKVNGLFPTDVKYPSNVELALIYKNETTDIAAKNFLIFARSQKAREIITSYGAHAFR